MCQQTFETPPQLRSTKKEQSQTAENTVSESNLPEAQCGFRPGCSTIDMFAVCQVKEKCIEQQTDLYSVFIDPT